MSRHHWTTRTAPGSLLVIFNWRDRRHPEAGGAEVVCEELATRFARQGHRVILLTAASSPNPPREERDGYLVIRRGGRLGVYPAALAWMLRHRKEIGAVIDSQNGIPSFAPAVLPRRVPVVLLIHHVHQDQFGAYFQPLAAAGARFLERTVTRWVYGKRLVACISPSTRRDVRVRLGLRGVIRVVPPGAPALPSSEPPPSRAGRPRIVCIGRLVSHKRTQLIVQAMRDVVAAMPSAELHLVGDGPARHSLEALVADLDLASSVVIHGALSSAERDTLLATAWLTVSASQREGWGLTILEANAFGVPAVAFRRPGLKDAIRDGVTGWLVDDEAELAETVIHALRAMADPVSRSAVQAASREWVAQFSWDAMATRVASVINEEAERLAHTGNDRRLMSDLACVAVVPRHALPDGWEPDLRMSDQMMVSESAMTFLFHGADTDSARRALARIGLGINGAHHPDITLSVARPGHLVALGYAPNRGAPWVQPVAVAGQV